MTHAANISGADGSMIVPVLSEAGTLMAYLLYQNPLGVLQEYYPYERGNRRCAGGVQAITSTDNSHGDLHAQHCALPFTHLHTDFLRWTGQQIQSLKKQFIMATEEQKGVASDRIFNDPAFERTRENMAEFGRAGKAARLAREIFRDVTVYAKDQETQSRLLKVFKRIVSTDGINKRGERTVGNGQHLQLKGFNFNVRAGLRETLYARCTASVDRVTGTATINIPAFVPKVMVQAPRGTTHFRIVAGASAVNFDTEAYSYMRGATAELPWDHVSVAASTLTMNFPAGTPDTVVVALGIEFNQQVNGLSYALKSGGSNATTIVHVDQQILPG